MARKDYKTLANEIADRIKEVRTEMDQTQTEFAWNLNVKRSHLADVETYRIEPSLSVLLGVLSINTTQPLMRPIDANWLLLGPVANHLGGRHPRSRDDDASPDASTD
jgi:DNA-binding XRE family transcriptional regulator